MPLTLDVEQLPDDPKVLRQVITKQQAEISEQQAELVERQAALAKRDETILELSEANAWLQAKLNRQMKHRFGRRSEKSAPGQLYLFAEHLPSEEVAPPPEPEEVVEVKKRKGHGRRKIPRHIQRKVIEHDLEDKDKACPCCQATMERFGKETSERYELIPSQFFVEQHVRHKYRCTTCKNTFKTAPGQVAPLPKSLAGPGVLAQVLVSKYADHLPLHRQSKMYARHGVDFGRSLLWDWVRSCAELLVPIYEYMKRGLLVSPVLWTDDTPVRVLDRKHPEGCRQGRLWVYLGDEDHAYNLFDYSPNRKAEYPQTFLKGYKGHLHADAYAGYDALYETGDVLEVGCWAHARRKFKEAAEEDPDPPKEALHLINRLFVFERTAKEAGLDPPNIRTMRQEKARPVLEQLKPMLAELKRTALPKSGLGTAVTYAQNQWEALNRYTEDGRLNLHNNASENALRAIAVGRKNWMFCGSDRGGKAAAVIVSLISTCKRHRVNPWAYLHDVLIVMADFKGGTMAHLTPPAWKKLREEENQRPSKPAN
jgi:transposase